MLHVVFVQLQISRFIKTCFENVNTCIINWTAGLIGGQTPCQELSDKHKLSPSVSLYFVCLFDLILYVPSTIFQFNRDRSSWVEPVLS